jgi:hypothetical protein
MMISGFVWLALFVYGAIRDIVAGGGVDRVAWDSYAIADTPF